MKLDPDLVALVRKLVGEALANPNVAVEISEHPEGGDEDETPRQSTGNRMKRLKLTWRAEADDPGQVDARPRLGARQN